jgi:hypothetical protein
MLSKKLFIALFLSLFLLLSSFLVLADNTTVLTNYESVSAPKSGDLYLNPDRWGITSTNTAFDSDWDSFVNTSLGVGWSLADWTQAEELFATVGNARIDLMFDLLQYYNHVYYDSGINGNAGLYNSGEQFYDSPSDTRSYFLTRWNDSSQVPSGWAVHDYFGTDNYYTLGSWYNDIRLLAVIVDGAKQNSPFNYDCVSPIPHVVLNVSVWDAEDDVVNVTIFDEDNNTLYSENNLLSGSNVTYNWSGLSYGTTYSWWASVTDGTNTTNNTIFNFTTCENSCSYTGSDDWTILLSDNCSVDDDVVVDGDLVVSGDDGVLTLNASVSAEGLSFTPDDFDGDSSILFLSGSSLAVNN